MSKWMYNGRQVGGSELVRLANKKFTTGTHGLSRYGRPHTSEGAYHFLTSELSMKERPSVKWFSPKLKRWV